MPMLFNEDGTKEMVTPENGKSFTLKEMYKLLDCSLVQFVPARVLSELTGRDVTLIIDEEGKLAGKKVNREATICSGLAPYDVIVGKALLVPTESLE